MKPALVVPFSDPDGMMFPLLQTILPDLKEHFKILDYGWCHLAIQAGQLREIMPLIKKHDLSMVAEMVLHLQADVKTRDVDWLAWEDPFILGRDAGELKCERENSLAETQKRLAYALPMVEMLAKFAMNGKEGTEVGNFE